MFVGLYVQIKQILSITLVFFLVSMQVRSQTAPSGRYPVVADTGKWHPEEMQIIWIHSKLIFNLPYEEDQSGVANILFQNMETNKVYLMDSIRNGERYINNHLLSGKYNAILLYNNGKYIKSDEVFLEKEYVNMGNFAIHPCDSNSLCWLSLRSFNTPIVERQILRSDTIISKNKIRGYVFNQNTLKALNLVHVYGKNTDGKFKSTVDTGDGYFELDIDNDTIQLLRLGFTSEEIKIKSNSGIIFVMEYHKNSPNYVPPDNLKSGPVKFL
ncbi:MAG: hypothetical protein LBL33_08480 [Tannerella sp.]|nr:hypothetical protein [Tannerella sp.]